MALLLLLLRRRRRRRRSDPSTARATVIHKHNDVEIYKRDLCCDFDFENGGGPRGAQVSVLIHTKWMLGKFVRTLLGEFGMPEICFKKSTDLLICDTFL